MRNEMKPGASIPRDSWSPDRTSRWSVLIALVAILVPTLGSGLGVYVNFDRRITHLESHTASLEKEEEDQKADVRESLKNIEQKLDRLIYNQAGLWSESSRGQK